MYIEIFVGAAVVIAALIAAVIYHFRKNSAQPVLAVTYENLPLIMLSAAQELLASKLVGKEKFSIVKKRTEKSGVPQDHKQYAMLNTTQQRSVYKIIFGNALPLPHVVFPNRTVRSAIICVMQAKEAGLKPKEIVHFLSKE